MLFSKEEWEARYRKQETPWDANEADSYLVALVDKRAIEPCSALDIGCGTGNETIFLAKHDFEVTGIDITSSAISRAVEKARLAGVSPRFIEGNFLTTDDLDDSYLFVLDRRTFHFFDPDERRVYVEKVNGLLASRGFFLLIVSSEHEQGTNRYHFSRDDISRMFGNALFLCSIELITLETHRERPQSWACLWQSRK